VLPRGVGQRTRCDVSLITKMLPDEADPDVVGVLLVSKEGQEHFPVFSDKAKKCSSCVLLSFFEVRITDNNRSNRRILNPRICLR